MRHHFSKTGLKALAVAFLFCLILTACGSGSSDLNTVTVDTIESPENKALPLEGIWKVSEIVNTSDKKEAKATFKMNDRFCLSPKLVAINDYITIKPTFSAKYVRLTDYLKSRLVNKPDKEIKQAEVAVLMIRETDVFSLDLVKLSEDEAFFIYDAALYFLKKEKDEVPQDLVNRYLKFAAVKETKQPGSVNINKRLSLVGIRETMEGNDGTPMDAYSTYMIFDDPNSEKPIISKASGLFTLDSENQAHILAYEPSRINPETGLRQAKFIYYSASDPERKKSAVLMDQNARQVTYINNNIVSFSKKSPLDREEAPRKYELRRLDDFSSPLSLSVTDIAPLKEAQAFKEQVQTQKSFTDPHGLIKDKDTETDLSNIGVIRETVSWSFVTSRLWKVGDRYVPSLININLTTDLPVFEAPKNPVSWSKVTNRFSGAKTASISPERDRILIKTEDELHYFHLSQGSMDPDSSVAIQLGGDSSVVSLAYYDGDSASLIRGQFLHQRLSQPQIIYTH